MHLFVRFFWYTVIKSERRLWSRGFVRYLHKFNNPAIELIFKEQSAFDFPTRNTLCNIYDGGGVR